MSTPKKTNVENGLKLRGFRKQNKLTQKAVADVIGKSISEVCKYELGKLGMTDAVIDTLNKEYKLKLVKIKTNSKATKVTKPAVSAKSKSSKTVAKRTSSKTSKSFAGTIKALRKSLELTQKAFAKKFKFTPSQVVRIESGATSNVNVSSLKAMTDAGIDIVSLVV